MKLKDLMEKYGEYDVEEWFEIGTDGVADEKGIKLKKPKPKTVWELKNGDEYYYITSDGDSHYEGYWNDDYDVPIARRKYGNVFLIKEEAEKEIERREVETLLLKYGGRRWFCENLCNWYLLFDTERIVIECETEYLIRGTIYFDTFVQARKAVQEIGEERLKKALFEVR